MLIHSRQKQHGFSMIEILISLFLVSLLITVMATIVVNSSSLNARTTQRSEAGSLAFQKVQDYINLSYDNIPIGDVDNAYEVEDFSLEAEDLRLNNASARVYVEPESVIDSGTTTTVTNFGQTVTADSAFIAGSEISAVRVNDATGDYWQSRRISDDSFTNYTYNGFDRGADNKAVPSIDLGSPQLVDTIRIEWWNCNYGANDFRIEAKNSSPNSNSGWTTIVGGIADNGIPCSSSADASQDVNVSSNTTPFRHWRMYIVDATHPDWNVISELEAFSSGVPGDIVEQHGADASSAPGDLYFSSSDLEMSENGSRGQQSVGIIFDDIDTPNGANIDNAYIQFTADESHSSDVSLRVRAVDRDNAESWSGSFGVDRAVDADSSDGSIGTSASTLWDPEPWTAGESGEDTRVDVTAVLQEIVDRTGWSVDNDIAFSVQYVSGSGKRVAERDPAPELVIEWSESTTTSTGIYIDGDGDGDVDNPTLVKITAVVEYDSLGQRRTVSFATFARKFGISD